MLDGSNYAYLEGRNECFYKVYWKENLEGNGDWMENPIASDANGKVSAKQEFSWSSAEDEAFLENSRALNEIVNGVD